MLLAFISNETTRIILWVVLVCAALGLLAILLHTVITTRRKKNKNNQTADTPDGESANFQDEINYEADIDVADANEIVLSRNVIYSAGFNGQIGAGKYVLLSADKSTDKFNVRFNGLVKEYSSGDTLFLADGDTISPVSGSVVLSKAE